MNKLYTYCLATGLFLFLFGFSTTAQTVTFTAGDITADQGDQICVPISVTDFEDIVGVQFSINYNPSMLEFVSLGNFGLPDLSVNQFGTPPNTSDGTITLSWIDNSLSGVTVADGSVVFEICFDVIGNNNNTIEFTGTPTAIEVTNNQDQVINFEGVSGNITLPGGDGGGGGGNPDDLTLTIEDVTANNGDQICLEVTTTNFTDLVGLQFSINYNASNLEFVSVGNFGLPDLSVNQFGLPPGTNNGVITLSWIDNSLSGVTVADGSVIFEVCFNVIGNNTSDVIFSGTPTAIEATNNMDQNVPFNGIDGTVTVQGGGGGGTDDFLLTIEDVTANNGDQICLEVTTQNFTDIVGMQFSINYNPAVLEFVSVGNFGLPDLSVNQFGLPPNTNAGAITLSWIDNSLSGVTVADGSVIFEICFNVIGNNTTDVSFSGTPTAIEVTDNMDMQVPFNGEEGTVTIDGGGTPDGFLLTIEDVNANMGDQICMEVTTQDFTDIVGMQFSINYDPSILDFVSVGNFGLPDLSVNQFGLPPNTDDGVITISWIDNSLSGVTVADGSVIFEICFDVIGDTQTDVIFSGTPTAIEVTDNMDMQVPFNGEEGTVSFGGNTGPSVTLDIGNGSGMVGDEVCVPVSVEDFDNITALDLSINYNATNLTFSSVGAFNLTGLGVNSFDLPPGGTSPGELSMSWTSGNSTGVTLSDGTVIFEVCFDITGGEGTTIPIEFSNSPVTVSASNPDGDVTVDQNDGQIQVDAPIDLEGFYLILNDAIVCPDDGDEFCIPVTVNEFINIIGMQFTISYDPGALEFLSVGNFSLPDLGNSQFGTPPNTNDGIITLSWIDQSLSGVSLNDGDPIFEVCFRALEDPVSNTEIEFTNSPTAIEITNADEDIIPFNSLSSTVSVTCDDVVPLVIANETVTPVSCPGQQNGAIAIAVIGGEEPYTYTWNPTQPNSPVIQDLAAGTYSVTVTSSDGQMITDSYEITTGPGMNLTLSGVDIENGNDGAVNLNVSGGLQPYTYSWTGPNNFTSTQEDISGLDDEGEYCVTVTDSGGCTISGCEDVNMRVEICNFSINNACGDSNDGSIDITICGGVGPFQYIWMSASGGPILTTMQDLTGQSSGDYSVTVTDLGSTDQVTGTFEITASPAITVSATVMGANGSNEGKITLTIGGGQPGYTVNWDNGMTGNMISNLEAGEYCATVTDQSGCTFEDCYTVEDLPVTLVMAMAQDVQCNGDSNGTFQVEVEGGSGPYSLVINGSPFGTEADGSFNIAGLAAGSYDWTITGAGGTTVEGSFAINEPPALAVTNNLVKHDSEDTGDCTGEISLDITGGAAPYDVMWNALPSGPVATSVCEGTYFPTITDDNGCQLSISEGIAVNTFRVSGQTTNVDCPNETNGNVLLDVSGGDEEQPYAYEWKDEDGQVISTEADPGDLPPGTYTVTVTEQSGNIITREYTITANSNLNLTASVESDFNGFGVSCAEAADGQLEATGINGQGALSYEWELDGLLVGTNAILNNAEAGLYTVTVIDEAGCAMSMELEVDAPPAINVVGNVKNVSCRGDKDGEIQVVASGGISGGFLYNWSNGDIGDRIMPIPIGSYMVTVTDLNGCIGQASFEVTEPDPITVTLESEPATEGCNGTVRAVVEGGNEPYTYNWININAPTNESLVTGLCPGEYFVSVVDSKGCIAEPEIASGEIADRRYPCFDERVVITPDGNGSNDEFIIFCIGDFPDNHLEVYNRWGQLVYETDNYNNTWEGTTEGGSPLPEGPYYYILEYTEPTGELVQRKGSLTILRE